MSVVYLVADYRPHGSAGYRRPYWRVVAMCSDIVHAMRYALHDSLVAEFTDHDAAWRAYTGKALPESGFRVIR